MGSGNWIVDNLNSALATWNEKLTEIWTLISTSPEEFKGGGIWDVILNIHDALRAIGYALLCLWHSWPFGGRYRSAEPGRKNPVYAGHVHGPCRPGVAGHEPDGKAGR